MKIVSRILKITACLLIFSVIGFLLTRILMAEYYPPAMSALAPTDALRALHATDPTAEVRQQQLRISYDDPKKGRFMADHMYYCPAAGELQITLRYNNSTLETVAADFGLAEAPAPSPALFDFSLTDGTEADRNRYPLSYIQTDYAMMYQYARLAFSGVSFGEETGYLRLEIYYVGDGRTPDYTQEPYATIPVYELEMVGYDSIFTIGDLLK